MTDFIKDNIKQIKYIYFSKVKEIEFLPQTKIF